MKKSIFTSALLISSIILSSCMKEMEIDMNLDPDKYPINVRIVGAEYGEVKTDNNEETRGTVKTTSGLGVGDKFKIFGYQNNAGTYGEHLFLKSPGVSASITGSDTKSATFDSGPYFWPASAAISMNFYALYPAAATNWTNGATAAVTTIPKVTAGSYALLTTMSSQLDLLYAYTGGATKGNKVDIAFNHALSRVTFQGQVTNNAASTVQGARITKIVIKNAPTTGVFSYTTTLDGAWTNTASVNVTAADQTLSITNSAPKAIALDDPTSYIGSFFMIPSAATTVYPLSGVRLDVTITWNGNTAGSTYTDVKLPITGATTWAVGKWYNYILTLDAARETVTIGTVTVNEWGTITTGTVQVNNN